MRFFYILNPLADYLDFYYHKYQKKFIHLDPISLVYPYTNQKDIETAALITAVFSFGRVELIINNLKKIFNIIGKSPYSFIQDFDHNSEKYFDHFVYRFYKKQDIIFLFLLLKKITSNDLIEDFLVNLSPKNSFSVEKSLNQFSNYAKKFRQELFPPDLKLNITNFFANPLTNSACKRVNLFFRWMVRKDVIDIGIWKKIKPSQLIIPLDTHIFRISKKIGLTQRKSPSWKMALEITDNLRKICPEDPVKYDFALCTIGKLNPCGNIQHPCETCEIYPICQSNLNQT